VTQSKRTHADRAGARDDEIDRLIERRALQRQQREVDEHLLAMTRAERMRQFKRRRYQWIYGGVLNGAAARRRALRTVTQAFEDRLDSALRAWHSGEPIGRDDEEILRERGRIR